LWHGVVDMILTTAAHISRLEIVEETDEGRQFSPNYIRSCRSFDLQKISEAITHIKMLNDET
jgi:hypothetical protein